MEWHIYKTASEEYWVDFFENKKLERSCISVKALSLKPLVHEAKWTGQ